MTPRYRKHLPRVFLVSQICSVYRAETQTHGFAPRTEPVPAQGGKSPRGSSLRCHHKPAGSTVHMVTKQPLSPHNSPRSNKGSYFFDREGDRGSWGPKGFSEDYARAYCNIQMATSAAIGVAKLQVHVTIPFVNLQPQGSAALGLRVCNHIRQSMKNTQ